MILFTAQKITSKEFNRLTEKVGWGTRAENVVEEALNHTLYSIAAYETGQLVGYGRIIGDKTIFLYIQDVMVPLLPVLPPLLALGSAAPQTVHLPSL